MECIVCYKQISDDEELCDDCKTFYKKYPDRVRERILDYYRKLRDKGGMEDEEGID